MPLKLLAWNIRDGQTLERVADEIRGKAPDIAMLCELRQPGWFYVTNQAAWLAARTGLQHYQVGNTVPMGLRGWRAVAILSRYELRNPVVHRVMNGSRETTYAILDVDAHIENVPCRVFSPRSSSMTWCAWC